MTPSEDRPVVMMIWTRPIDDQPMAGRLHIANAVREVFREVATVREHVMIPAIVDKRWSAKVGAFAAWAKSVVQRPLLPLQCSLYAGDEEIARAIAAVGPDVQTIYLDGVRTFSVLRELRNQFPDLRLIVDLDDLMSRRLQLLLKANLPLSPGHLTMHLPRLATLLMGFLSRMIVRYEAYTLPAVEAAVTHLADLVVLLSAEDMSMLGGTGSARRETILPRVSPTSLSMLLKPDRLRFIFIGSDALTQNRLTIDYLVALWRSNRIEHELVIFGRQNRRLTLPPHVSTPGYAEDMAEIYDGRSVLVSPSFLRGGIKTKVLEAFAHGVPVIGNAATFESLALDDYPLKIDDEAVLLALLRDPEGHRAILSQAAAIGTEYLASAHAPGKFADRWAAALRGGVVPSSRRRRGAYIEERRSSIRVEG